MNDNADFARFVADQFAREGSTRPTEAAHDDILARATRTRQRPSWLALIKEPPMRISSHVAVGSPALQAASVLTATLLIAAFVAGAGIAGQRLLAADDTFVVDQSGGGDFTTITEAVEEAQDGDTILVRPGRYVESVAIVGKHLTIKGDGDRDEIVVEAASTVPPIGFAPASFDIAVSTDEPYAWAVLLADTETVLSNVTVIGQQVGTAIPIVGAASSPTLDAIVVRVLGQPTGQWGSVNWTEGSGGVLQNSVVEGWLAVGADADVEIDGNDMPATCIVAWDSGATIVIRENTIHGCPYEKGVDVASGNTVLIEGNDIWVEDLPAEANSDGYSGGRPAIEVTGSGPGTVTIRDNELHDSRFGIVINGGDPPLQVIGNRVHDNGVGVSGIGESATLSANTIERNVTGVEIGPLSAPTLEDNTIAENQIGLSIGGGAEPALTDNTICANATSIVSPAGDALDPVGNETCPDEPAA